ncbi:hypothetical protein BKA80DRAFT_273494 [Phyllosticta citrichinensis]
MRFSSALNSVGLGLCSKRGRSHVLGRNHYPTSYSGTPTSRMAPLLRCCRLRYSSLEAKQSTNFLAHMASSIALTSALSPEMPSTSPTLVASSSFPFILVGNSTCLLIRQDREQKDHRFRGHSKFIVSQILRRRC